MVHGKKGGESLEGLSREQNKPRRVRRVSVTVTAEAAERISGLLGTELFRRAMKWHEEPNADPEFETFGAMTRLGSSLGKTARRMREEELQEE